MNQYSLILNVVCKEPGDPVPVTKAQKSELK